LQESNKISKMYILLVDNNRFYGSVLRELMLNAGFDQLGYIDSGLECVLKIHSGDSPDVIIIDENQCLVNGINVLQTIHNYKPDLTFIILTSPEPQINIDAVAENRSIYYIAKESITADNLPQMLYDIFAEKINISKKSSPNRPFSSLRKSFSSVLN
jgi:DNA-binding NarL/FixJ family response regulator